MKRLLLLLAALLLLSIFTVISLSDDDEHYVIKHIVSMPKLTQDSIIQAVNLGDYEEIFLKASIYSEYYSYSVKIYPDGSGTVRESLHTRLIKELIANGDTNMSDEYDDYIRMINDLPEGEYDNYYIFVIDKEEILVLLNDLGDGTVPFNEEGYGEKGIGMGFGIDLYLNGEACKFRGREYEREDINIEVKDWVVHVLGAIIEDRIEEVTSEEYHVHSDNIVKECAEDVSFIEEV